MSRAAVARELQRLIEESNRLLIEAEKVANSSGGLINPKYFRGARSMLQMAAGDLDQKGLLEIKTPAAANVEGG